MKKFLIILLSLFMAGLAQAEPFGFVPNYEKDNNYQKYGLYKITHGLFVPYYIVEDNTDRPALKTDTDKSALYDKIANRINSATEIKNAFDEWFKVTRGYIAQQKRTDEFADIIPLFDKEIKLRKMSLIEHAEIIFYFTSIKNVKDICGQFAAGCFAIKKLDDITRTIKQKIIVGPHPSDKKYVYMVLPYIEYGCIQGDKQCMPVHGLLLHEIGHFLALSDQYYNPGYDNRKHLKTPWRLDMDDSLMAYGNTISCDEADGIINLLDYNFSREHRGAYPARAKKGWKSFCDDTVYKEGKVLKQKEKSDLPPAETSNAGKLTIPRHPSNSYTYQRER